MGQSFLGDFDAGDPDQAPVDPDEVPEGGCPECGGTNTRLLSESSPRLCPEGHPWLGTRPRWCSDCSDVVERVPV